MDPHIRSHFARTPAACRFALLLALLVGFACGGNPEEEAFREASDSLAEAQAEADVAREKVEKAREGLEQARAELDEADASLATAEDRVHEARTELANFATDDVVFRAVQLALLETPELSDVAIRANVDSGVVSLWGSVRKDSLRERAIDVAKSIPGVVGVESHIAVEGPVDEPEEGETEEPSDKAV